MTGSHARLRSFAAWIILLSACTTWAAPAPDTATTERELQVTIERLNALTEWFSQAEKQRNAWLTELKRQDRDIANINSQVADVEATLERLAAELDQLAQEMAQLDQQKKTQAERISHHITAAYRLTGSDFLKQLLNQENPDHLDRMMRYHRFFSESRLDVLAEYRQTLEDMNQLNQDLTEKRDVEDVQRATLQERRNSLSDERATRSRMIAELDSEKETLTEEFDRLEKDRQRLESLLAELRRRSSELDGSAFVAARGTLPMPVTGRIVHAFGSPRADNRLRWHGIDIVAEHGTPITAVFRGRVIFADWLRGFGFLAVVDHGSEYMTLYGHVDVLYKKVGDWVESGEPLAAAGNSGGRKESGVYFEVRHEGQAKDPITWVRR